jgi:hypothetical protein
MTVSLARSFTIKSWKSARSKPSALYDAKTENSAPSALVKARPSSLSGGVPGLKTLG